MNSSSVSTTPLTSSAALQSTPSTPALNREEVSKRFEDYQKALSRYSAECKWAEVRNAYKGITELLESALKQSVLSEQDIGEPLNNLYDAYSRFEREQGDHTQADELAKKVNWLTTSLSQTSPKKRTAERQDSALFRSSKGAIPGFLARPDMVPVNADFDNLMKGVSQVNLQGNISLLLHASFQTPPLEPTDSPEKITNTSRLADCLSGRINPPIDSAKFTSYQALAERMLDNFGGRSLQTLSLIQEIIFLGTATNNQTYMRRSINQLQIEPERILNMAALQGQIVLIRHRAAHRTLDDNLLGDCTQLLDYIHRILKRTNPAQNAIQLGIVLQAVSLLLDTMFDAGFTLDPPTLKGSLEESLKALADPEDVKGHMDESLAFQAKYALQALKRLRHRGALGNRVWAIVQDFAGGAAYGVGAFASNDPDKFWEAISRTIEGFKKIKDEWDRYYKGQEWYLVLYRIDKGIQLGYLNGLEQFVKEWKLPKKKYLLQGLCFCLERIVLSHAREDARKWALGLLQSLKENEKEQWGKAKYLAGVQACARATLERIELFWDLSNTGLMERVDYAPFAWHPFWRSPPQSKLLQAVQDEHQQQSHSKLIPVMHETVLGHATALNSIQSNLTEASTDRAKMQAMLESLNAGMRASLYHSFSAPTNEWLSDVKEALHQYYKDELKIERISGEELKLKDCYINLAIVESAAQRAVDKAKLKEQAKFYRPSSYEEIKQTNLLEQIQLEKLFDKHKLRNGQNGVAKCVLILGRAGSGKTTLSKKLVHFHKKGLWQGQFDVVLWLPLRQLKTYGAYNLKDLLERKYFSQQNEKAQFFAEQLSRHTDKILLILDGLDEVATELGKKTPLGDFLKYLLAQPHVIVTSRPAGVDTSKLEKFDLELETIGFSQENVRQYVKAVEPEAAAEIQALIDGAPIIQELVNTPVLLDTLCYVREEVKAAVRDGATITMTALYQAMVDKLLRKDAVRLDGNLDVNDLRQATRKKVTKHMADVIDYLSYLSFKGLQDSLIEFDLPYLQAVSDELEEALGKNLPLSLQGNIKYTSFLHTADASHFIHLTFQEYFTAGFLAKHFQAYLTAEGAYKPQAEVIGKRLVLGLNELQDFVAQHKYDPRYQIVWGMVAGLLEGETLEGFFHLFEKEPRDLFGSAHLYLMMHCLHEARTRLPAEIIKSLEKELERGLLLGIGFVSESELLEEFPLPPAFPEHLLLTFIKKHSQHPSWIFRALEKRPTLSGKAVETLLAGLEDEDIHTRSAAAGALAPHMAAFPEIQPLLVARLEDKDEDPDVRKGIAIALAPHMAAFPEIQPLLVARLEDKHEDSEFRELVARVSVRYMAAFPKIQPLLLARLGDKDEKRLIREDIANVLTSPMADFSQIRQMLLAMLEDKNENPSVIKHIARVLVPHMAAFPKIQPLLIARLEDENENIYLRKEIAEVLAPHMVAFPEIQPLLVARLEDENEDLYLRKEIAEVLAPHMAAFPEIRQLLLARLEDEDEDTEVRGRIAGVLAPHMAAFAEIQPLLVARLEDEDEDPEFREVVARALVLHMATFAEIQPLLVARLEDENPDVQEAIAIALAPHMAGFPEIQRLLVRWLEHVRPKYLLEIAFKLAPHMASFPEVQQLFLARLVNEKDFDDRESLAYTLGEYGGNSKEFLDKVTHLLGTAHANLAYKILEGVFTRYGHGYSILPHLSSDQFQKLYTEVLLPNHYYFDSMDTSLYYHDGALHFYIPTGLGGPIPISKEQYQNMVLAVKQAKKHFLDKFTWGIFLEDSPSSISEWTSDEEEMESESFLSNREEMNLEEDIPSSLKELFPELFPMSE